MHWANGFVGIPHVRGGRSVEGADCWGIGVLAYRARANIELKLYDDTDAHDERGIAGAVEAERRSGLWVPVVGDCCDLDVVEMWSRVLTSSGERRLMRVHVGFFVAPDRILHSEAGTDCVCVPKASLERRIAAIWRHRDLA